MATKDRTVGKELTTTNSTVYQTPPFYTAMIDSIIVTNASSATQTYSLDWYDSEATTYFTLAELTPLPPNGMVQITDCLFLKAGDLLRGLASTNSAVTIVIRMKEDYSVVR